MLPDKMCSCLPQEQLNAVARFLDARDMKQEALNITSYLDYHALTCQLALRRHRDAA